MHIVFVLAAIAGVYVVPFSVIVMLYKRELKRLENQENGK